MSEPVGDGDRRSGPRVAAGALDTAALDAAASAAPPASDPAYARPAGVNGSFAANPAPPVPESRRNPVPAGSAEVFGPPPGSPASFAADPAARLPPRPSGPAPAVPPEVASAFGRSSGLAGAFDAPWGSRIDPAAKPPPSPWWKDDAAQDPWRRYDSPFWLGRAAVFLENQPVAVDDGETVEPPEPVAEADEVGPTPTTTRLGRRTLLTMMLVGLLAGGLGGGIGFWLTRTTDQTLHDPDLKLATVGAPANRPPGSVADIARRVGPAVVEIDVSGDAASGTGSGVVIDKAGYILTNNHVVSVAGSDGSIRVVFSNEAIATARLVGRDPTTDLAVIKVTNASLTVAQLGDSSSLAVGDPVVAIGSPLGLQGTVTTGIVSALDRAVHVNGDTTSASGTDAVIDAIQTDASINPGNSGGALVNADGAVVGIPSAIASIGTSSGAQSGSIGLGFAIPINAARVVAQELIRTGKAVHASLGLRSRSVTDGTRLGAYILQIDPGGAADKAGLKVGDVVKVVDTEVITSSDALIVAVNQHRPGDVVTVRYIRAGTEKAIKVTLASDS